VDEWRYEPARDLGLTPRDSFRSVRRERGLLSLAASLAWMLITRAWLRLYHRLEVRGREHLPAAPPFLVVANHSSHLDAPALAAALPLHLALRAFPVAAGDTFFESRATAAFASLMMNALPIWRRNCGPHALGELRQRLLGEPCVFILFPEGTRSRTGAMGAFKPGIGRLVCGAPTPVPVVPCHLDGAFAALPPHARYPRPRKLTLRIGPPIVMDDLPDRREGWERITHAAEAAVRALAPQTSNVVPRPSSSSS